MKPPPEKLSFKEGAYMTFGVAAFAGAFAAFLSAAQWVEKRGKMLQAEWNLKYDKDGHPRPEFWQRQLLTDIELEKQMAERHDTRLDKSKERGR